MKKLLILMISLMFTMPAYGSNVYKWVDEKGTVNFTDDYKKIPPAFRNRVEQEEYLEREPPPLLSQKTANTIKGGLKTENYGRDYWKKQLDEATSNYEKVREELLQEGEQLVIHRLGSKTQYQMFTEALPSISERLETYKEQMIEAQAMEDQFTRKAGSAENAQSNRPLSPETDIYGRDETWWKEKVRPWREQLKEAKQNYDEASDAIVKQLERLGPFRWGGLSLTQYQMISSRLTTLYGRMAEYQTQISEAKVMLARLSEEARQTKADPAWLK